MLKVAVVGQTPDNVERLEQGMHMKDARSLDRSAFALGAVDDPDDAARYWRQRTAEERIAGIETLRQIMYGYDPATEGLQGVLELAELE